jgi:hypothetical protein
MDQIQKVEQVRQGLLAIEKELPRGRVVIGSEDVVKSFKKEYPNLYEIEVVNSFQPDDLGGLDTVRAVAKTNTVFVVFNPQTSLYDIHRVAHKSSACFIATAVYGSPLAPEVLEFRRFRDKYLLPSKLGRAFVSCYYFVSPPVASLISRYQFLRTITRRILLKPILRMLRK